MILFADDAEMEVWLADKDKNVGVLMKLYNPRLHRCLYRKDTRQITVITGRHD